MAGERDEIHVETDEVRGGATTHTVRWVLAISLIAAVVLLSAIWIFGAASQGDEESQATVSGTIDAQDSGDDTDGIVSDEFDSIEGTDAEDPLNIPNEAGEE